MKIKELKEKLEEISKIYGDECELFYDDTFGPEMNDLVAKHGDFLSLVATFESLEKAE